MWLINTKTLRLEQVVDETQYVFAILSHTWAPAGEEVNFQDMQNLEYASTKPGFEKIKRTCNIASRMYKYVWIDTCCIDKTSSAELSEAINSMFRWYRWAEVCYVFLADLEPLPNNLKERDRRTQLVQRLPSCKWFTRGWTLQELIAPRKLVFFDREWSFVGEKSDLEGALSDITRIDESVLRDSSNLHSIPVARRMSWAAGRRTTRVEDMAYCLLGVFDISMPLLYGEGSKAFLRLQQQIISENSDMSLFAWQSDDDRVFSGIFADSPDQFAHCATLKRHQIAFDQMNEVVITNIGVRLHVGLRKLRKANQQSTGQALRDSENQFLLSLDCAEESTRTNGKMWWLAIYLMKIGQTYVRWNPHSIATSSSKRLWPTRQAPAPVYVHMRLLPDDIERIRSSLDTGIIIRYAEPLASRISTRAGKPSSAYDGTTIHPEGRLDGDSKASPEDVKGAVFHTQGQENFLGIHYLDLKLGEDAEDLMPIALLFSLQWTGTSLKLNCIPFANDSMIMQYAPHDCPFTEQECLDEVRDILLTHYSDLSGLIDQKALPSEVVFFKEAQPEKRVKISVQEDRSLLPRSNRAGRYLSAIVSVEET